MAKIGKRIERSYATYLKYRAESAAKGFGLDRELTIKEYADAHVSYLHKKHGKHPARDIARAERTFTRSESAAILRHIKNADQYSDVDQDAIKELKKKYKRSRDIYGLSLSQGEIIEQESERRSYWAKRGVAPKYIIQANARAKLFNELRDAGLSYKEVEEILYGKKR